MCTSECKSSLLNSNRGDCGNSEKLLTQILQTWPDTDISLEESRRTKKSLWGGGRPRVWGVTESKSTR